VWGRMIHSVDPSRRPPAIAMLADPIEQSAFEADIVTKAFRLDPLML